MSISEGLPLFCKLLRIRAFKRMILVSDSWTVLHTARLRILRLSIACLHYCPYRISWALEWKELKMLESAREPPLRMAGALMGAATKGRAIPFHVPVTVMQNERACLQMRYGVSLAPLWMKRWWTLYHTPFHPHHHHHHHHCHHPYPLEFARPIHQELLARQWRTLPLHHSPSTRLIGSPYTNQLLENLARDPPIPSPPNHLCRPFRFQRGHLCCWT